MLARAPAWVIETGCAAAGVVMGALLAWPLNRGLGWFFRRFNAGFRRTTDVYTHGVDDLVGARVSLLRLGLVLLGGWAAWKFVEPSLGGWISDIWPWLGTVLTRGPRWVIPAIALGLGGLVGLLLGLSLVRFRSRWMKPLHYLLRFAAPAPGVALAVYVALLGLTYWAFTDTARGFIPAQDMGYLMVTVQLPDAAATERTDKVMHELEDICLKDRGIWHATSIVGTSFMLNATGPNFASMFLNLKPYHERRTPDLSAGAITGRLLGQFDKITDASVQVFPPPPVRGAGRAGGFAFVVEARGDLDPVGLQEQTDNLITQAALQPGLVRPFTSFRANVPQLHIQPDARACQSRGVSIADVNDTLGIYQGSLYVNDFNLFGRTWQVIVQSDAPFRTRIDQLKRLRVRSASGTMVPLGSLVDVREVNGPLVLSRYNMYPSATVQGSAAPGISSRQAIDIMEQLARRELPPSMGYEWTDMSYLELQAGNTAIILFGCAMVAVFLVLAAQYESWSLPLAVILVVPMCLLSAVIGVQVGAQDINIFVQVGFVVLVGLASKNAILIVEFAKVQRAEGLSRRDATLAACKLRLRPIIMTSVAFILGVVPLLLSVGAGFEMRRALGTAVFSGMIGVTLFGIFLTPVFFYVIDWLGQTRLFHSRSLQLFSDVALGSLTLGVRQWGPRLVRRRKSSGQRPASDDGDESGAS